MFFFFNDTATTEIYTLSLHDALPILVDSGLAWTIWEAGAYFGNGEMPAPAGSRHRRTTPYQAYRTGDGYVDRKSTRLNSSHANISYAVFCLKKKKTNIPTLIAVAPKI